MKRSEMLDKIDDLLISRGMRKSGSYDLSQDILDVIEKAGMLPPYNPPNLDHGSIQDCVWEPEEEMTDEELSKM